MIAERNKGAKIYRCELPLFIGLLNYNSVLSRYHSFSMFGAHRIIKYNTTYIYFILRWVKGRQMPMSSFTALFPEVHLYIPSADCGLEIINRKSSCPHTQTHLLPAHNSLKQNTSNIYPCDIAKNSRQIQHIYCIPPERKRMGVHNCLLQI